MLGLNAALSLASEALQAQDGAIGIASNNIANVNIPGYSRQVVSLSAAALTQSSQNATNGVGQLQTADGALSQVTTLPGNHPAQPRRHPGHRSRKREHHHRL